MKITNTRRVDRRIIRTRQRLTNSLRELIVEKGFEQVTVQDVLNRAKVGRSTFYAHFESIDHLLPCEDNFREMLSQLPAPGMHAPVRINFLSLYQHVAENQSLAAAILSSRGGPIVTGHLKNVLVSMIREQIKAPSEKKHAEMFLLVIEATAAALITLLVEWYLQKMPFDAAVMAAKSARLVETICGPYRHTP